MVNTEPVQNAKKLQRTDARLFVGSCTVALEQAGPDDLYPNYLSLSPNKLRGLAGFLIETCANRNGGIGGFVTVNFENAENYIESLPNNAAESRRNATGRSSPPAQTPHPNL